MRQRLLPQRTMCLGLNSLATTTRPIQSRPIGEETILPDSYHHVMSQPTHSTQELHPAKGRIGQDHHLVAGGDLLWQSAKQLEGQCSGRGASLPPPKAKAPGQSPAIQLQVENHQLQPPLLVEDANQTSDPLELAALLQGRQIDDGPQDRPPTRFAAFEQRLRTPPAQGSYNGA